MWLGREKDCDCDKQKLFVSDVCVLSLNHSYQDKMNSMLGFSAYRISKKKHFIWYGTGEMLVLVLY